MIERYTKFKGIIYIKKTYVVRHAWKVDKIDDISSS